MPDSRTMNIPHHMDALHRPTLILSDIFSCILIFLLLALILVTVPASASSFQSSESIYQSVEEYVRDLTPHLEQGKVEVKIDQIDPRLNLTACTKPLEIFTVSTFRPMGSNHIGVRCDGPSPWKIHIPVDILIYEDIIVAASPLPRGAVVKESDILVERRDISRLIGGFLTSPADVLGKEITRPLQMGAAFPRNIISHKKLIQRGQQVILVITSGSLNVSTTGKALMQGGIGDIIKVSNISSQRIVEGTITAPGTVEIRL